MTESTLESTLESLKRERQDLIIDLSPYKIGKYDISNLCLQTNPCQHYVTNRNSGNTYIMTKFHIFLLSIWNCVNIPHFQPDWYRCN